MTYFQSLNSQTQNLVMLNFEFFGKKLLLFIAITISLIYIFYSRKKHEETPYLLVGLTRTILFYVCWVFLFASPLFIFYLYPQVALDEIMRYMFIVYIVSFFLIGTIVFINIIYFGPLILVRIGGFNPMAKKTDKVIDHLFGKIGRNLKNIKWGYEKYIDKKMLK